MKEEIKTQSVGLPQDGDSETQNTKLPINHTASIFGVNYVLFMGTNQCQNARQEV